MPLALKFVPGPKTFHPHCTSCGNYLLPCTKTANGVHPEVVGAGPRIVIENLQQWEEHELREDAERHRVSDPRK